MKFTIKNNKMARFIALTDVHDTKRWYRAKTITKVGPLERMNGFTVEFLQECGLNSCVRFKNWDILAVKEEVDEIMENIQR